MLTETITRSLRSSQTWINQNCFLAFDVAQEIRVRAGNIVEKLTEEEIATERNALLHDGRMVESLVY